MHAHVAVPRVTEIVAPHLKQATDPLVATSTPETQALMAKQAADIRTRMSTTDERFAVMDEMGVDMQLICPAPPQIYYTCRSMSACRPPGPSTTASPNMSASTATGWSRSAACRCRTATRRQKNSSAA